MSIFILPIFVVVSHLLCAQAHGQWVDFPKDKKIYPETMSFVNARVGAVEGSLGGHPSVFATSDSGKTWSTWSYKPWEGEQNLLRKVALAKTGIGWVVGRAGVLRTDDFGVTWRSDSLALPDSLRTKKPLTDWTSVETANGWAFIAGCRDGRAVICRRSISPDSVWHVVDLPGTFICEDPEYLVDVVGTMAPDGTGIVAIRGDTLLASVDSGMTWQIRGPISQSLKWWHGMHAMSFQDSLSGWMVWGIVAYTRDGGRTWMRPLDNLPSPCSSICFVDTLRGWTADQYQVFQTCDGAKTWTHQLLRERTFPLQVVEDRYLLTMGDDAFWRAEYRDLCDSVNSGIEQKDEQDPTPIATLVGTEVHVDLRRIRGSSSTTILISDALGRTLVQREIGTGSSDESVTIDLAPFGSGVYITTVVGMGSASSLLFSVCY
jgi:photosystem II stability/assembly factor-like uncharacterized protein